MIAEERIVVMIDNHIAEYYPQRKLIRCKDCAKKELCSIFRDVRQELGFCAWAKRKEE